MSRFVISTSTLALLSIMSLTGPARAVGIVNGNFETGDLTGWNANTLTPPGSTPVSVGVATVGKSQVGQINFSSSVGGHYAGSLSQDFYTGAATKATYNVGWNIVVPVTPFESTVVDTLDV